MTGLNEPVAIVGSTPFSALLAGLMAIENSRKVTFLHAASANRLPVGISTAYAPVTRPETWRLALAGRKQAAQWIERMAPGSLRRTSVIMRAASDAARHGLEHMRHIAFGLGVPVERAPYMVPGSGLCYRFDDGWTISGDRFGVDAADWLAASGVEVAGLDEDPDSLRSAGSVILADDTAVQARIARKTLGRMAIEQTATSLLCGMGPSGTEAVTFDLDTGAVAEPRGDGSVSILWPDEPERGLAQAASLPGAAGLRLIGQRPLCRLQPHDGAPVIGPASRNGPVVIFGLGALDLALAPAIARFLSGTAQPDEAQWFAARGPTRRFDRSSVAEFSAPWLNGRAA